MTKFGDVWIGPVEHDGVKYDVFWPFDELGQREGAAVVFRGDGYMSHLTFDEAVSESDVLAYVKEYVTRARRFDELREVDEALEQYEEVIGDDETN